MARRHTTAHGKSCVDAIYAFAKLKYTMTTQPIKPRILYYTALTRIYSQITDCFSTAEYHVLRHQLRVNTNDDEKLKLKHYASKIYAQVQI